MACAQRGCDNRGKLGLNIVGHGSCPTKWGRRWRYRCTVCGRTVSTTTGTAYSGLRCARREFNQVASLRVEGVSISATARVTGHSRNTIARWLERASTAPKRFNQRMLRDFAIIGCRLMSSARSSATRAAPHGCVRPSRRVPDCGPGACSAAAPLETPRPSSTTSSSADAWGAGRSPATSRRWRGCLLGARRGRQGNRRRLTGPLN